MTEPKKGRNKTLVLKVFDTLFSKCDYTAAEGFWSPKYIGTVPTSSRVVRG